MIHKNRIVEAGVVLIINDEGLILGISRKNDRTKFGLVGGGRELFDFSIKETAIREAKEEACVIISDCEFLYERVVLGEVDGVDYHTTCFYVSPDKWEFCFDLPRQDDEGDLAWLTIEELTVTKAAFGEYNINAIEKFKQMYPNVYLEEKRLHMCNHH